MREATTVGTSNWVTDQPGAEGGPVRSSEPRDPGWRLDRAQQSVVDADKSTILLGPAGTGKTVAMVHASARWAVRRGSARVLAVAADRVAARAWQSRVARLVPGAAPTVTTVAALAQSIIADDRIGPLSDAEPVRTLTAPEQEARIREILTGTVDSGSVDWPTEWKPALPTRSFARSVRRAVARARRCGWEPDRLREVAEACGDAGWRAIAQFLDEYLQVLDWEGAVDYSELALRARRVWRGRGSSAQWDVVLVDDAHFLDHTQVDLLTTLAGNGGVILATADPDQSVGSYRGSDPAALSQLVSGRPVVIADTCYRGGAHLRDARAALMAGRWYPGLPRADQYRTPALNDPADRLTAVEYDDSTAAARHIAAQLRHAHRTGVPWRDMAVLTPAPGTEIPLLARALSQARIPVHVPAGDSALRDQPAVATLLSAARLVLAADVNDAALGPIWQQVLGSDMFTLPPRQIRRAVRAASAATDGQVTVVDLARDPVLTAALPEHLQPVVRSARHLVERVTRARRMHSEGAAPAEVLWQLWHGDDTWPQRLRQRAVGRGEAAVAAGRELDAVISLFRLAERAPERWGGSRGLLSLIEEIDHQEIPAEPDLKTESRADQVTVMSLHRSPGRSWPMVVVTGMTESSWWAGSDRGLIEPQRLRPEGLFPSEGVPQPAAAERRRLLNIALSRAERSLLLVAAGGGDDPPTPLLAQAGIAVTRVRGLPAQPQTALDVLLQARRSATTGAGDDAVAALAALAALAAATDGRGVPIVAGGDPQRWDGVSEWTRAPDPLRPVDQPLALSGSGLAVLDQCQLRWALQREVHGERPSGARADFGITVHDIAAQLADDPDSDPAELLTERWSDDGYDASWYARLERATAEQAVQRAAAWLKTRSGRVSAEHPIDVAVPVRGPHGDVIDTVRIRGAVDVVENDGRQVRVWDYKTQRSASSVADTRDNVQLAVYQRAVAAAVGLPSAGAGLVHLCLPAGSRELDLPKVRDQGPAADLGPRLDGVLLAASEAVRAGQFRPNPGPGCRTCAFRASCPAGGQA